MKSPADECEKSLLLDVVEQLRDPEETLRKQARIRRLIFGLGDCGLLVAFILAINDVWHPFSSAFLAAVSGFAIGWGLFLNFARKQWQITRKHINLESIQQRLKEMDTGAAN